MWLCTFFVIFMAMGQTWAEETNKLEATVLQDLLASSSEKINIKHSNSRACKNPCTVKNYLATHFDEIMREIEKIKKTHKRNYAKVFGTSVSEKDEFKTSISGSCSKEKGVNFLEEDFKKANLKLPAADKILVCKLKFGFAFGENVWSEELIYLKNSEDSSVIAGSFLAVGTP